MKVHNHAPPLAAETQVNGPATPLKIDTDLPVYKVKFTRKMMSFEDCWGDYPKRNCSTRREMMWVDELDGEAVCTAAQSPCVLQYPRGSHWLGVESDQLNSPRIYFGVDDRPLVLRVRREQHPAEGGFGITLIILGGSLMLIGGIQAATGQPSSLWRKLDRAPRRCGGLQMLGANPENTAAI